MKTYYFVLTSLLLLVSSAIYASPAYPSLLKMKQPNGTEISLFLKGDEKIRWMESEDGYSLLYDKNKYIVYAILNEEGNMVPSNIVAEDVSLRSTSIENQLKNIPKRLKYSDSQINSLKALWETVDKAESQPQMRSSIGTARAICTLIQFADKNFIKTREEFEALLNQRGYNVSDARGSVKDFYLENSYGKLDLIITVAGPYTVSKNMAYYGENNSSGNDKNPREMAQEAADLTFGDPNINPADYDNDGDGYIDAFHIIYAGYGEEAGAVSNAIWAHETHISPRTYGNKRLDTYSCSPELRGNSGFGITRIGVICHELGHVFGAPDFYDTDGSTGGEYPGTGRWDLMGGGNWNNDGISPAHINMYQKIQLGWVNPITLNDPQIVANMPNSAQNSIAYRFNTPVNGEYYVLENRQKVGFDSHIPGTGLLIYHVSLTSSDIVNNIVNNKHPQKMYPVCASASAEIPIATASSYGSLNSSGCPFPGSSGKTSFADYTIPAAFTWSGAHILKPITDISEQNSLISFRFAMPNEQPVSNVSTTVTGQNVLLNWNRPNNETTGYSVYRNNQLIIKLVGNNSTSYTQYNVNPGTYSYCVTAIYDNKESIPVCSNVSISGNLYNQLTVKNLTATNNPNNIELSWENPYTSTWYSYANDPTYSIYYPTETNTFTAAVRYPVDDLRAFQGSRLTKVNLYVINTNCSHKIQIWSVNPDNNPGAIPILEQTVNSSTAGLKEITLNQAITVEAGKELWIGVRYELNPLTHVAIVDQGPIAEDRNFVLIEGYWYNLKEDPDADFNWYISGYFNFVNPVSKYNIYRDNVYLAGVTDNRFTDDAVPAGSHIYCVSILNVSNQESEQSCVQTASFSGIETIQTDNSAKIHPNPIKSGEVLTVDVGEDFKNATLLFYTASGQLIRKLPVSERIIHQKTDMAPGLYILQIRKNTQISNLKVIIK
jgi:M6 family metalloprotease-like protein